MSLHIPIEPVAAQRTSILQAANVPPGVTVEIRPDPQDIPTRGVFETSVRPIPQTKEAFRYTLGILPGVGPVVNATNTTEVPATFLAMMVWDELDVLPNAQSAAPALPEPEASPPVETVVPSEPPRKDGRYSPAAKAAMNAAYGKFAEEPPSALPPSAYEIVQPIAWCDGSRLYQDDAKAPNRRGPKLAIPCPGCRACS